jgi:hypothetical protein
MSIINYATLRYYTLQTLLPNTLLLNNKELMHLVFGG